MHLNCLTVQSFKHAYKVRFEEDFAATLGEILLPGDVVTVDATVLKLYGKQLDPLFKEVSYIAIKPAEEQKSYQGLEPFINHLIDVGFRKNNRLIAIGGGITQDITAFTASIIFRGVELK